MNNFIFEWSDEKNLLLKKQRSVCFENVVTSIQNGKVLDIIKNKSKNHPGQYCLIIDISNYAYIVPFVKNDNIFFLKTIYKSRKQTEKYLRGNLNAKSN